LKDGEGNAMDLKADSNERDCACPADSRIARHFDAKVAERLAKCQDPALVAVSQRLGHSGLAVQLRAPRGSVTVNPLRPSRGTSSEREMNWQ